jgi:hypothetical protein
MQLQTVLIYTYNNDLYNITFKNKYKLYTASGSAPSPSEKFWVRTDTAYYVYHTVYIKDLCRSGLEGSGMDKGISLRTFAKS